MAEGCRLRLSNKTFPYNKRQGFVKSIFLLRERRICGTIPDRGENG